MGGRFNGPPDDIQRRTNGHAEDLTNSYNGYYHDLPYWGGLYWGVPPRSLPLSLSLLINNRDRERQRGTKIDNT